MDGGLGFRDFKAFNMALVGKNWWRMHRNPHLLLSKVYKAVYFSACSLWEAKKGNRPSYAWSSLWRTRWLFDEEASWRVGDGNSILIDQAKWLPSGCPLVYREDIAAELGVKYVADLFNQGTKSWDVELVQFMFWPATAESILKIPLPVMEKNDVLTWPHTLNGEYTAKSGYEIARNKALSAAASSSSVHYAPSSIWKKLWKCPTLPRCRELIWRACLKILPVRASLRARGMEVDELCPWCGETQETTAHALLFCHEIRRWWFASPLGLRLEDEVEFHDFVAGFFSCADQTSIAKFCELCYVIWEARNKLAFEGTRTQIEKVLARTATLSIPSTPATQMQRNRPLLDEVWHRPEADRIKINFDAAWDGSRSASFGFVARNDVGEVLAAATKPGMAALSALLAETTTFRWAIVLAMELGFRQVLFETDCKMLHDAWNNRDSGCSYLFSLLQDCKTLVFGFNSFSLLFVRRTGNKVADSLAKHAEDFGDSIWIDEVPQFFMPLVLDDVRASMPS